MAIDRRLVLRRKQHNLLTTSLRDVEKALEMLQTSIPFIIKVRDSLAPEADAVLAAMEPTPDTGPSADEIRQRVLLEVRARIQRAINEDLASSARHPTDDKMKRQYRDGFENGQASALLLIATMEKAPDAEPSADEIARRAGALAGDVLSEVERPNLAIAREIRAEIQAQLDADLKADASNPTTIVHVSGHRQGRSDRSKDILAMIDAAIAKAGEAENGKPRDTRDDYEGRTCCGDDDAK